MGTRWVGICVVDEIEEEDVLGFEHNGKTYAVYHTPSGYFASDGICTHETANLADGIVIGDVIECPMHQGRFDIPTGKAKSSPVCVDLNTYEVKVDEGKIFVDLPD